MFFNHLKVTLRHMAKSRGYTLVNLAGLAAGLACCLCILLFVLDELRYDRSYANFDDIYRVTVFEDDDGNTRHIAHAFAPLAPLINTSIDEVTSCVRVFPRSTSVRRPSGQDVYQEGGVIFADSTFFEVFSHQFITGDARRALHQPNGIVLTRTAATRYFGDRDPLGESLLLDNTVLCEVTGVIEPPPHNTSLKFDIVASMPGIREIMGDWVLSPRGWYHPPMYTYLTIPEEHAGRVEANMPAFEKAHLAEHLDARYDFILQPLHDVHFEMLESDLSPAVRRSHLAIFSVIALLVLAIACFNYVNLSLAQLLHRLKGMGIRKVLGAQNRHILHQVGTDSLVHLSVGMLAAIATVILLLPVFNRVVGKEMQLSAGDLTLWTPIAGVTVLSACIISSFLFVRLRRRNVVELLGQQSTTARATGGIRWNRSFVIAQFVIAIGLIMATGIVRKQMHYVQSKDLGLESERLVVLPIRDDAVQDNYVSIKNELVRVPGVTSVSAISNFPWEIGFYDFPSTITGMSRSIEANLPTLIVDHDFLTTMDIDVVEGRGFDPEGSSSAQNYLINEAIAEQYGIEQLEGLRLTMNGVAPDEPSTGDIIGITENFHLKSLHHPVDPVVITTAPDSARYFLDNFVVRLGNRPVSATLAALSSRWQELVPERPFDYFFLDEAFDRLYQKEQRMRYLFNIFALLAVAVACLGLLALAAYNAEQRTKEIGIRKVLGATRFEIVTLLSKDFARMILVSFVIAIPIVWLVMRRWLQEFAFRTEVSWWIFACAGAIILALALLAVAIQALRVASADPVEAIRME